MTSQLVTDLGRQYVNDYFHQALFLVDNRVISFARVEENGREILAERMPETGGGRAWEILRLPVDVLKDFTTFSIPKLGYRNIQDSSGNKAVINLACMRSTRRGFRMEHLTYTYPQMYPTIGLDPDYMWETMDRTQRARLIYFPEFVRLKEGLKQIKESNSAGFALSEDAAIHMEIDSDAEFPWSIVFKSKTIGGVDEDGQIVVKNKVVSRGSLRKLLEVN